MDNEKVIVWNETEVGLKDYCNQDIRGSDLEKIGGGDQRMGHLKMRSWKWHSYY